MKSSITNNPHLITLEPLGVCACLNSIKTKKNKFALHSQKCIFVGYPFKKEKGSKVFDL